MRCTRQGSYPTSVTPHATEGQNPSRSGPTKRRREHLVRAEQRWRELREQGAQIDAAARAAPPRRRLEAVPEGRSAAKKPLGLVWVLTPSYSITMVGLKKVLEGK